MQLLELRLTKVLQSDAQLHRFVIAAVHIVQASVEVRRPSTRHIRLEYAPITVAGRLVVLVDVDHFVCAHLIARQEFDRVLDVAWVVSFLHCFNQLVVAGDHLNGIISHICVVQIGVGCLQAIVKITQVEVIITNLIKLQSVDAILNLLHLHFLHKLSRHLVSLDLLLGFVLKMAPNDVEDVIFKSEAVAKTTLVTHGGH